MGKSGLTGAMPLQSRYNVTTQYPMDIRQMVESEAALWDLTTWGSYSGLKKAWSFSMYPNMIVSIENSNLVYLLNGSIPIITDSAATTFPENTWLPLATQEWVKEQDYGTGSDTSNLVTLDEFNDKVDVVKVSEAIATALAEAKQYADDNDANTTYGLEYDSASKTIKLVEKGVIQEIDATTFIKDGMLSSVVADLDNNKLIFYWNTEAGIETTEIALSSIADIYTGKNGEEINVSVSNSNEITASLTEIVKNNIALGVNAYSWGDHSAIGYLIPESTSIFNEDVLVGIDLGNFKAGDNLSGWTLPEIIAQLCGASLTLSNFSAPSLSMSTDKQTLTVTNNTDYDVELVFTTNVWEGQADLGASSSKVSGEYKFTNLNIPAHSSKEGTIEWNFLENGILTDLSYNIECAFKYKVYRSESATLVG